MLLAVGNVWTCRPYFTLTQVADIVRGDMQNSSEFLLQRKLILEVEKRSGLELQKEES